MEKLTKETRTILISQLEQTMSELESKKRIVYQATEFIQSYKIDCILLQKKIDGIKSVLIEGEFEF